MRTLWPVLMIAAGALALPAAAQNVASFQVLADSNRVVAGATTRARAIARDPQSKVIPLSYRWTTADTNVATVGFDGAITGVNLGITRVRATVSANLWAETTIQVIPASMELSPNSLTMTVGERRQFTARVLDANGKTLTVPLRWQVLSGQGFNSNAGTVSNSGMVTALAEGALLVRAAFVYNTYIPGLQNEAIANAPLRVSGPEHYAMKRVLSAAAGLASGQSRRLSFRPSFLSGNDAGQLVFAASFDGRANGLVQWDGAKLKLLAGGGASGVVIGTAMLDFFNFAINARGDVVSTVQHAGAGQALLGRRGGSADPVAPILWDNAIVGSQYEGANGLRFPRCPLASDGGIAHQANFRNPGESAQYNGLFYQDEAGTGRLVASTEQPLPGLNAVPVFDSDAYGPAPGGTVYFLASGGGKRGLFRQSGWDKPEKLLLTGETFLGANVNAFMGSGMFFTGGNGDVVFGVQLSNNTNHLVWLPGGSMENARTLRVSGWNATFAIHPEHGVLFQGSEPNQPNGIYLWKESGRRQVLITGRTPVPPGAPFDVIYGAAVDGSGTVSVLGQAGSAPLVLARLAADGPVVLLRSGDAVDFPLPDNPWAFVPGGKNGGPHVVMGGTSGSIFEVGFDSAAVAAGELITGVYRHTGSASWNARRGNDGHLYVTQTNGYGVVRKNASGGAAEQVFPANRPGPDGAVLYSPYEVRVNASGQLLTTQGSDRGDTRLALTGNGSTRILASTSGSTNIEGFGALASWSDQQMDDAGRVLAIVRNTQGQLGMALWTGDAWTAVWRAGQELGPWRVSNVANLKAVADRFYFRIQVQGGVWAVASLGANGSSPTVALDVNETTANGAAVVNVGLYDVNNKGDILFQSFGFGVTNYGIRRAGGEFRHVYTNTLLTAEGDLPVRLLDCDLRDDGTAYLLFVSLSDEPVVYRADPR